MAVTARTIIRKALQKIGVLYKTEEPSADEANDGLFSLNAMVASWSNDSMLIYVRSTETFLLNGNQISYTIGPGGDWDTTRPVTVLGGYTTDGAIDWPIENVISDEEYMAISFKSIQIPYPEFMNYTNGYPLSTIKFYPAPSSQFSFTLLSEKELSQFSSLDSQVDLPPGWIEALIYNLAIRLAPEYGQQIDEALVVLAKNALNSIKEAIIKVRDMDYPYDLNNTQNVFTGWFYGR